jgi:uncharacterized protein
MKSKVQEEIKSAMKSRDQRKLDTLRGLLSEIKLAEIDTKSELSEEHCVQIVKKEIKKRRDASEFAEKAGRQELIEQNQAEILILETYLPAQLSSEELRRLIETAIVGGADNIGKVMGELNKLHKGKFDGKTASVIIKERLGL